VEPVVPVGKEEADKEGLTLNGKYLPWDKYVRKGKRQYYETMEETLPSLRSKEHADNVIDIVLGEAEKSFLDMCFREGEEADKLRKKNLKLYWRVLEELRNIRKSKGGQNLRSRVWYIRVDRCPGSLHGA
jgi:hypothetical protein